jgi:hypothetical protein
MPALWHRNPSKPPGALRRSSSLRCREGADGRKAKKPIERSLADRVKRLREEAASLPPGLERNDLLHQARQAEISLRLIEWIASPGLTPPPDDLIPIRRHRLRRTTH